LIAQLCSKTTNLPERLEDLYEECKDGTHKADIPSLIAVLRLLAVADELHDLFIVVDALDECPKDEGKERRNELLDLITEIKSWPTSNIHLLVTSRREPDIKEKLAPLLTAPAISLEGSEVGEDIEKHVKNQLATDPKLKGWSDDLKAHIERTLVEKANGM
jgi:ankyrin repeat domain-containing protein 50